SLPLNCNLSNYTTNTQPDAMDVWGDGIANAAVDITAGGAVAAVAGGTATCGFGPCAMMIQPSNPYGQACATFVMVNDSTGIGQSDNDSWRHGWSGREALTKRR